MTLHFVFGGLKWGFRVKACYLLRDHTGRSCIVGMGMTHFLFKSVICLAITCVFFLQELGCGAMWYS